MALGFMLGLAMIIPISYYAADWLWDNIAEPMLERRIFRYYWRDRP